MKAQDHVLQAEWCFVSIGHGRAALADEGRQINRQARFSRLCQVFLT
jgi:hypothetical protein